MRNYTNPKNPYKIYENMLGENKHCKSGDTKSMGMWYNIYILQYM